MEEETASAALAKPGCRAPWQDEAVHEGGQPSRAKLMRVSYVSILHGDARVAARELETIVAYSVRRNLQVGISGHLCYDADLCRVWQVIEGTPEDIGKLWAKISADGRHSLDEDTIVVEFPDERWYPLGWGMRYSSFACLAAAVAAAPPLPGTSLSLVARGQGSSGGGAAAGNTSSVTAAATQGCSSAGSSLVQLSYRSAIPGGGEAMWKELEAIVARSVVNNARASITGWLLYDARTSTVYQVLEGSPSDVDRLWSTIFKDPRHVVDLSSVTRVQVEHREFPDWSMVANHVEWPCWTWARAHEHVRALSALSAVATSRSLDNEVPARARAGNGFEDARPGE